MSQMATTSVRTARARPRSLASAGTVELLQEFWDLSSIPLVWLARRSPLGALLRAMVAGPVVSVLYEVAEDPYREH